MKFDSLKDKFNYYRGLADYKLMPNSYVMVMLDGRSFSKKVKNYFKKPFDDVFITAMNETAKYLCEMVGNCKLGYVQSDEISLIIHEDSEQDPFFGNRLCKLQSIISSMATAKFNQLILLNDISIFTSAKDIINFVQNSTLYEFDCKAWCVPNANDAYASILYRQNDCIRNSKAAVAQNFLTHKELVGKSCEAQIELVKDSFGVNWYKDFNNGEKYGRFIVKTSYNVTVDNDVTPTIRNKWLVINGKPLKDKEVADEFMCVIYSEDNKFIEICNGV